MFRPALSLCLALLFLASMGADKPKPPIVWKKAAEGFDLAYRERKPILLVFAGTKEGLASTFERRLEEELVQSTSFRKYLKKFVAIRVVDGDEKSVKDHVGELGREPAIILFDFAGTPEHRFQRTVPRRTAVQKAMKKTRGRNAKKAELYKAANKLADRGSYAAKLKKYREAVGQLLQGEKLPLPPDSEPLKKFIKLREVLDAAYKEAEAKARELEEKEKLAEALAAYQAMQRDFPFPERVKELGREISRVMYAMGIGQGGGTGAGGM